MVYLVNALPGGALAGHFGTFRPLALDVARRILSTGFVSAIGHEATASALTKLLGFTVPFNRTTLKLNEGDTLIVAVTPGPRLPEGKVMTESEVEERGFEFLYVAINR